MLYHNHTVAHMGDTGDLIAALAVVRYRLFGSDLILYHCPWVREPFTPSKVANLASFVSLQSCINSVRYSDQAPHNAIILDEFRKVYREDENLSRAVARGVDLPPVPDDYAWLEIDHKIDINRVVINRTARYHQSSDFWRAILAKYHDSCFVGTVAEHTAFSAEFGPIRHHVTPTFLDFARAVYSADLYCGNQSSGLWLRLGFARELICEQCWYTPNCFFDRPNAHYLGRDGSFTLPGLH